MSSLTNIIDVLERFKIEHKRKSNQQIIRQVCSSTRSICSLRKRF